MLREVSLASLRTEFAKPDDIWIYTDLKHHSHWKIRNLVSNKEWSSMEFVLSHKLQLLTFVIQVY